MSGSRNKRKASDDLGPSTAIPTSMEEISDSDRLILDMRRAGKTWVEVQRAWEKTTRTKVARSTLPNRYLRLKNQLALFTEDDDRIMLKCKEELESTFEREKWGMIAEFMEKRGGDRFSAQGVQNRFAQIEAARHHAPPVSRARPAPALARRGGEQRREGRAGHANKHISAPHGQIQNNDDDNNDEDDDDGDVAKQEQQAADIKSELAVDQQLAKKTALSEETFASYFKCPTSKASNNRREVATAAAVNSIKNSGKREEMKRESCTPANTHEFLNLNPSSFASFSSSSPSQPLVRNNNNCNYQQQQQQQGGNFPHCPPHQCSIACLLKEDCGIGPADT